MKRYINAFAVFTFESHNLFLQIIVIFNGHLHGSSRSLSALLLEALMQHLPTLESDLPAHIRLLEKHCPELESKLSSLSFLPQQNETFLSDHIKDLNMKFIVEKRREYLVRARQVLLADYHNTMLAAGDAQEDDPSSAGDIGDLRAMNEQSGSFTMQALRFDPCQVSLASCRILKLVHEIIKQAVASSPDLARTLYHCARDCFELFLAIIPIKFSHILTTVPRMGAVLYNDCIYIAHNCTIISHLYRQDLGRSNPSLLDCCGFIDFIPRFRVVGEQFLTGHVEEQLKTLLCLVDRIHINPLGMSSTGEGGNSQLRERWNDEESAGLIVKHLQKLTLQWEGVLQEPVCERLLGYIVEGVLRAVMAPILQVKKSLPFTFISSWMTYSDSLVLLGRLHI